MSILDEWVVFDTNIWIFGLRHSPTIPACAELLENLGRLRVVLPRQILQELHANLSEDETRTLFRLLTRFPERFKLDWEKTKPEIIAKYQRLSCKLGDAVVAAHLEELDIKILVSENRDFLEEVRDLPFRRLTAAQAFAELEQSKVAVGRSCSRRRRSPSIIVLNSAVSGGDTSWTSLFRNKVSCSYKPRRSGLKFSRYARF